MTIAKTLGPAVVQMGPREYHVYLSGTGTPAEIAAEELQIVASPKMYDSLRRALAWLTLPRGATLSEASIESARNAIREGLTAADGEVR
jgi:hypothetical protein